jgi:hypothetical protein
MMCGSITYPISIRIVKRLFKLRGFYAIHLAIAPFLAAIHINVFAALHAYQRVKIIERNFVN